MEACVNEVDIGSHCPRKIGGEVDRRIADIFTSDTGCDRPTICNARDERDSPV
jgi:hypothetical protein